MIRYRLTLKIRNKCYLKIECVCRRDLLAAFSSWRSYYNGHGRRILSSAEKVQGESPGVEQEEDVETASAGRGRWRLLVPTWERGLERAGSRSWPIGPKRDLRPIQPNALAAHTGLRRPSGGRAEYARWYCRGRAGALGWHLPPAPDSRGAVTGPRERTARGS